MNDLPTADAPAPPPPKAPPPPRPLSDRAEAFLALVHEATLDFGGWTAPANFSSKRVNLAYAPAAALGSVGGGGDAQIVKALVNRGLARWRTDLGRYSCETTEDGALEYERLCARERAREEARGA